MKKKVKLEQIRKLKGKTDWEYLRKTEFSTIVDPNAPELTPFQLSQMKKPKKSLKK